MSQPTHIWIVEGSTGEYSDRCSWSVAGFTSEQEASEYKELCQAEADNISARMGNHDWYDSKKHGVNKYDSQFHRDYTGTSYNYHMITIKRIVDGQVIEP